MIKFLSYVKKFSAMLFLSLVVSISLFNKNILAIDPAKVTINSNGITYVDSYQPRVSYELSADKKSFHAVIGDERALVYSQVSYTQDGKDVALPVTSIATAKGVSSFTLNLVDLNNDKVKIIPSGYGDLTVTLNYNGNLSKAEARKIFEGMEFENSDIWMSSGNAIKLIVRKPAVAEKSFEIISESSPKNSKISYGKTSTEITEYGMVWLKETSDGTSAWYGIDNSDGTFKIGSKFWVKWLSPKIDREEFEEYYNKLDDEHKKKVDNNNLWIFLTGVTDPDGNEYTNFYGNLDYYIQIGEDWDKDDINVVFINDNKDSVLDVSYDILLSPDGKDEFAKVVMKHFSPYAVYDEKDETKTFNVSKSASIKTGESVSELIFMFWISLLLVAFLNRKMNKNSICS